IDSRDRGCRFPGCTNRRWTDHHHIVHWAHGGETSTENLVLLCRRHHRLVHEGGFRVARAANGELRFRRPDGSPIEASPPLRVRRLRGAARRRRRLRPAQGSVAPRSAGERMDLDLTVSLLADQTPREPRGP
ncbi:MAG: HNH endonuclease signature motif containing protein, partial [Solirubrobacterales bacterium]